MRGERICENDRRFESHHYHKFFHVSRTFSGKFKHEEKQKDKALIKILLSITNSSRHEPWGKFLVVTNLNFITRMKTFGRNKLIYAGICSS